MGVRFSNNAKSTVTAISGDRKSVTVIQGEAASFPDITGSQDYTYITFALGANTELIKATNIDFSFGTIQLDTPLGSAFGIGTAVELRTSAELLTDLISSNSSSSVAGLDDVTLTTPDQDQILSWNGFTWTNMDAPVSGGVVDSVVDGGGASSTFGGAGSTPTGQGVTIYATPSDLDLAPLVAGALAYVTSLQAMYACTGTSWASLALDNAAPIVNSITTTIDDIYGINPATGERWDITYPGWSDINVDVTDPDGTTPTVTIVSSDLDVATTVTFVNDFTIRLEGNGVDEIGKTVVVRVSDGDNYSDHSVSVTMREVPFVAPVAGQQLFETGANFTVPANVYSISAVVIGGGGHGGYTEFGVSSGAPGQRGGIAIGTIPVTPNEGLLITVGAAATSVNAGNGSTISRNGAVLLQATGAVGSSLGTPQDFAVSPSSGSSYAPHESYVQRGGAGLNTLTMVGSYGSYLEGEIPDPNPTYAGGHGGSSFHQGLNTWMDSHNGWAGGSGIVRIIWGYTDSSSVTLRSFPSTGIGNY